jgi:hypothetical protein
VQILVNKGYTLHTVCTVYRGKSKVSSARLHYHAMDSSISFDAILYVVYWGRIQHGSVGLPVIGSSSRQDDAEVQREIEKLMKEYSKNSSPLPDCTGNEVFFTNYSACVHIIYNPLFWCTKKIPLAKGEPPWVFSVERLYSIYTVLIHTGKGEVGRGS